MEHYTVEYIAKKVLQVEYPPAYSSSIITGVVRSYRALNRGGGEFRLFRYKNAILSEILDITSDS